ncbi:MAG TPA: glycosyltransferase [Candidatus Saccharimonadales bacterium]|nr:glycosyltransferase [Candidatus Saccharimonadales bacterium]
MYLLVGLLVAEAVLEGLLCGEAEALPTWLRKSACMVLAALLICAGTAVCLERWTIWAWGMPVVAYRLVNLLRVYDARLPWPQLRTVTFRAFGWLATTQLLITVLAWLAVTNKFGGVLLNVLVVAQLLSAFILLRASLHTWRHAGAPTGSVPALSDKEALSVSVLVPARNETDDLDRSLRALVASDYPKLEILVLDDCSANRRTPEIIRSFAHGGVRFIQGKVPDETRWLAKNYAYDQLVREASGELLLFCGVDAVLQPHTIRQLVEVLEARGKDMLSVMPLRHAESRRGNSLLQAMRYYWEICLPRRLFKRPPVLSTCWLIRRHALERMGGLESVSRSVNPEAPLARQAVVTDAYSFIRSDEHLGVYSNKPAAEQYDTSVRVRYPQLHRRLELIALAASLESVLLLGPFVGLLLLPYLSHAMAYGAVWVVALLCLFTTYGLVAAGARLTNRSFGWLLMPVAFAADLAMMHISLWKYEFSSVDWKGRNVCIPVMQILPRLPNAP